MAAQPTKTKPKQKRQSPRLTSLTPFSKGPHAVYPGQAEKAKGPQTVDFAPVYVPALRQTVFQPAGTGPRVRVLSKGRRLGYTHSAINYTLEEVIRAHGEERRLKILWVDTINANIERYVQRYLMPLVKIFPQQAWHWAKQEKLFQFTGSLVDFRSAESPENIEGFGYDIVILNEAGIILEDRYLWENAIMPTTVDNPNCVIIVGGTPKGRNLFAEMHEKAASGTLPGRKAWTLSTFYNLKEPPYNGFLSREGIQNLLDEYGGNETLIRQEVFGEFVEGTEYYLFRFSQIQDAKSRTSIVEKQEVVWGVDVGAHGSDPSVLTIRRGWDASETHLRHEGDHDKLAKWLFELWDAEYSKPDHVVIEYNPPGWQLYNKLANRPESEGGPMRNLVKGDTASKNVRNKKFFNMRYQMYADLADNLKFMRISDDALLTEELAKKKYEMTGEDSKRLPKKEKEKSELRRSPDRSDSLALTFYKWNYAGAGRSEEYDDVDDDFSLSKGGIYTRNTAGFSF